MEKNKKILLGGIVVTIIAGAALFCFVNKNQLPMMIPFLEPTKTTEPVLNGSTPPPYVQLSDLSPEAIANWNVCRNEKYGYEFKYPKGWRMNERRIKNNEQFLEDTELCTSDYVIIGHRTSSFRVGVSTYKGVTSLDEYHQFSPIQKETKIDGERALWIGEGEKGVVSNQLSFVHKGKIFNMSFSGLDIEFREAMVSTFKFID